MSAERRTQPTEEDIIQAQRITAQEAVDNAGVRPADCRLALEDCLLTCGIGSEAGLEPDATEQFIFRLDEAGLNTRTTLKLSEFLLKKPGREFYGRVFALIYRPPQELPVITRGKYGRRLDRDKFIQQILSRERSA